eukprot:330285-Rhodomonas_salina.3
MAQLSSYTIPGTDMAYREVRYVPTCALKQAKTTEALISVLARVFKVPKPLLFAYALLVCATRVPTAVYGATQERENLGNFARECERVLMEQVASAMALRTCCVMSGTDTDIS